MSETEMITILSVGDDLLLLQSRAEVLRTTGANVLSSDGESAVGFIAEWEFDLIVLCHSVQKCDVERIAEAARSRSAMTRILLLDGRGEPVLESADAVMEAGELLEPGRLVHQVMDLLNIRKTGLREASGSARAKSDLGKKKPSNYPAETATRKALTAHFERHRAS